MLACQAPAAMTREIAEPVPAPDISAEHWINSAPLTLEALRGKVVLVEFWTFACWNCKNVEPHVKGWHGKFADKGLTIVGVHTPEFEREKVIENVRAYVKKNAIAYPIAIDNDYVIWRRFHNRYWPALYLIDKEGRIRYTHFGEGSYAQTEAWIEKLLAEEAPQVPKPEMVSGQNEAPTPEETEEPAPREEETSE
ncbi:MAG: redoxin domain-containing protein [Chrysiogenetes bacterium]|nr:redoxin domain-containing protein [Chrysiogenetes bacterium]